MKAEGRRQKAEGRRLSRIACGSALHPSSFCLHPFPRGAMADPTSAPCPHCGHPYPMTAMQKELYRGRTLSCNNCAKPFSADNLMPVPMPAAKPWAPPAEAAPAPPPRAAAAPPRKMRGWVVVAMSVGGVALLVLLLVLVLLPPLNRAREQARRVQCAANMRQIGQA